MQRGCGSKHGDNGKSGYGCNHTAERLVAAPPPPSLPQPQFTKEEERVSGRRSALQLSLSQIITDMGEADYL